MTIKQTIEAIEAAVKKMLQDSGNSEERDGLIAAAANIKMLLFVDTISETIDFVNVVAEMFKTQVDEEG